MGYSVLSSNKKVVYLGVQRHGLVDGMGGVPLMKNSEPPPLGVGRNSHFNFKSGLRTGGRSQLVFVGTLNLLAHFIRKDLNL